MRRPSGGSRDESIAAKWSDLRQYEEDQEAALREAHQVFSPNFSRTSFCGSSNDYILFTTFINADNESYTRLWDRILDQEKVEEEEEPRDVSTS